MKGFSAACKAGRYEKLRETADAKRQPSAQARSECLAIGLFAVISGGHENDALLLIDLVKEAPIAHSVAPSRRVPILQSLDIRAGMRGMAKNRVNIITKLGFEPPL